ncbi:MAG: hypothetical protein JW856_01740 [Dehalococcoidales bacterium]|nr:hypothetical protein [Dehalococcoidales bacterium]
MEILKRVIGLSIAGIVIACIAAAGVWAYASDTEGANGNQIMAGTLDLNPSTGGTNYYSLEPGGNNVNGYVVFTNLKHGQSGSITWTLTNNGSLNGTLTIVSSVSFGEGTHPYTELENAITGNNGGSNGDLDSYVGVRVTRNGTYILGDASNYVPLSGLEAVLDAESQSMDASGNITYVLEWSIASDIKSAGVDGKFGTGDDVDVNDNIIQSDTAEIGVTFTLTQ